MDLITWLCKCGCGRESKTLKLPLPEDQYYAYSHRPRLYPENLRIKGFSKVMCGTKYRDEDHRPVDPDIEEIRIKKERLADE